ncbi:FAD-dependent oxidoreductase [Cesiribacter sp. SM1]|uniref:FAD-dependent oxidoreductase n=1 Tax=Cesiribacter sp. SM1 TaxID=2861196 RepID=UPI001CD1E8E1|nr:FAD-dependent oxidoreductase [Cesiribacter sp. SM1]
MKEPDLSPKLSKEQIEVISMYGKIRHAMIGESLIKVGDRNHDLFVVLEGAIAISDDHNNELGIHLPGEFTGNSDSLSARTAIFNAFAQTNAVVLQIPNQQLKEIIASDQELSKVLLRTFLLRRAHELETNVGAIKLLGSRYCAKTFKLREFLSKNHIIYSWIDLEKDDISNTLLAQFGIDVEETPIIIAKDEKIFKNPSIEEIAEVLGLLSVLNEEVYDVIVVGAGPAGLAASVYASSEGLKVITIDNIGPGGQAGASSKIENYLGFPTGISGSELANNAYIQAQKFGCHVSIPRKAKALRFKNNCFHLELDSETVIKGSTVIAATGARYRKLPLENLPLFEGRGVYYGAGNMEAQTISGKEIMIVGGGNSAGQAAIFLATKSSQVHLVIRGENLQKSMSTYLISRIMNNPNIRLHTHSEIIALEGGNWLREVILGNNISKQSTTYPVSDLFLFLGAIPCSEWLTDVTCLDKRGFVYTGRDIPEEGLKQYNWPHRWPPQSLETCLPGLFAVGDIRSGSVKRVASAVGEGSMAVSQVHSFLSRNRIF